MVVYGIEVQPTRKYLELETMQLSLAQTSVGGLSLSLETKKLLEELEVVIERYNQVIPIDYIVHNQDVETIRTGIPSALLKRSKKLLKKSKDALKKELNL